MSCKSENLDKLLKTLLAARNGDEDATLVLIEKYKPLIIKHVKRYAIKNHENDDLMQIGYLAIIKGISKYNVEKGGADYIDCYIINSIKNAFRYLARNNIKFSNESSLDLPTDGDGDVTICDLISDDINVENHVMNIMDLNVLNEALLTLSDEEIKLINIVYFSNNTTLSRYCKDNNLNYPRMRRRLKGALGKMKKNFI